MSNEELLIVDDDEVLCMQLAEALEGNGFSVRYASDTNQAKNLIEESNFKSIILDYKMTGMTGVDLLRTIKKKSLSTKVFVVSGRPFIEKILKDENVAHLVAEVIAKPFDVEELSRKLKGE